MQDRVKLQITQLLELNEIYKKSYIQILPIFHFEEVIADRKY